MFTRQAEYREATRSFWGSDEILTLISMDLSSPIIRQLKIKQEKSVFFFSRNTSVFQLPIHWEWIKDRLFFLNSNGPANTGDLRSRPGISWRKTTF
jgi:hypothetical protein